ncbi:hypothetical protein SLA2020_116920 [Shorea laevis]
MLAAVSDVMRHLRKSIHCSLDDAKLGPDMIQWNRDFKEAVDKCLVQLLYKVGDAGPSLDLHPALPNPSYRNKAFPEALFHHLLPAMVHPDHETRIGAHSIFSVVLVPSSVCPHPSSVSSESKKAKVPQTLSRAVSVFSSSAALFETLREEKSFSRENVVLGKNGSSASEREPQNNNSGLLNRLKSSYGRAYSVKDVPPIPSADKNSTSFFNIEPPQEVNSLRLTSRQITLLLSSIWAQSLSPENTPQDCEAIAHTYCLVLLFSRAKNSSHEVLVRSFQLAFSLRNISLGEGGQLPPSRHRSLFTLATSMLLFSSKAYNILSLVYRFMAILMRKTVDPFLCLITQDQSRESLTSETVKSLRNLSQPELSNMWKQLLNEFVPDDACPLEAQMLVEAAQRKFKVDSDKKKTSGVLRLSQLRMVLCQNHLKAQTKPNTELTCVSPDFLSVNQLLESVLETANQFGRISVSTGQNMPYKEMASHCKSLVMGKQLKMSLLVSAHLRQESLFNVYFYPPEESKAGNPFLDQNLTTISIEPVRTVSMLYVTEYPPLPPLFH